MSIISKMRRQKAVWWKRSDPDQFGKFSFLEPVEIACRWEDVGQEFRNAKGEVQISNSVVYVDRVLALGDRLWRGELNSAPDDPLTQAGSYAVQRFDQLPNLKATETLYTAYL
jgi:hypothetical protein